MRLSLAKVAVGAGALLEAPSSISSAGAIIASGYSIDSRTVAPGELFFAVRGDRFDGHDFVASALERGAKFSVLKSLGNLNNAFGLPLQLLRLEPEHEFAVIEMGMNHAGEIAALARIAAPNWGVITNVGTAHIENFTDGQAGIARAKFELVEALPANGVVFLNCGDVYASQFGRDFTGRVVYFGAGPCGDPQILGASKIFRACTSTSARASTMAA